MKNVAPPTGKPVVLNPNTKLAIAERVEFGKTCTFGPRCRTVSIGFGTVIGDDVYIDAPIVRIGDYCKIHRGSLLYGYQPLTIGHNCWVGQNTIIDSIGGATIGNNVGIGALSQLWSHIKFGDTLAGCRWNSSRPLVVEDDVWFVGHCVVCPITAHQRSMALVGSVITKDMLPNHIYAGVPAVDVTQKMGSQFAPVDENEQRQQFEALYSEFLKQNGITPDQFQAVAVEDLAGRASNHNTTFFCLRDRTYLPSRSEAEFRFMRFLLYDRAKFVPASTNEQPEQYPEFRE
ncbi:MAG: hypothetical protein ABIK43_02640 [candidate division WOR-3 bacterium]